MKQPKPKQKPPAQLLAAFRAVEAASQIAVIMHDDEAGFDALTLRVMSSWQNTEHTWEQPKEPCPSDRPDASAWAWLRSGWTVDIDAVAAGANVARATAREKIDVLIGNRLIYPDGATNKYAEAAVKKLVASRLGLKKKTKSEGNGDGEPN